MAHQAPLLRDMTEKAQIRAILTRGPSETSGKKNAGLIYLRSRKRNAKPRHPDYWK